MKFKKLDGTHIDDVRSYVKDWVSKNPYGKIIIGCDSQVHGRKIKYSVAVCMQYKDKYGQGHGAHVIAADVWHNRMMKSQADEMPSRLWKEAEYVIKAAMMIDDNDEEFKKRITIHLDYNSDVNAKSNILYASGMGYVTGLGYNAKGKPDAYVATHSADNLCK